MARQLPDELKTSRLILRAPQRSDARALFDAYTQDARVSLYMTWRPHKDIAEAIDFISRCIEAWEAGERQPYVLVLAAQPDSPIGVLDARVRGHLVDIGYVLARAHWGSGLMPEAVAALAQTALSMPSFFRIQAVCDIENIASARTLEKAGFTREATLPRYMIHPNMSDEPRACFMYARCK